MPRFRLGVLDQSPIGEGRSPADAIAATLALARRAEALGYSRYWFAEHHSSESFAGTCPEIMIARIAAETRSLRVGSGGVMLMHRSALVVAEQFRMLETLHPGRVDLGIGRAPGIDPALVNALSPNGAPADLAQDLFESKLDHLVAYLRGEVVQPATIAMPRGDGMPELWMLGSGTTSAALAARLGWSFCFAQFLGRSSGESVVDAYREAFRPSPWLAEPRVAVGAFVLVAEDDERAEYLIRSAEQRFLDLQRGRRIAFPSPQTTRAYLSSPDDEAARQRLRALRIHGDPERVQRRLEILARRYATNEFLIMTVTHDPEDRLRSYELLAELADLEPPKPRAR